MNCTDPNPNIEGEDRGGAPVQLDNFEPTALDRVVRRDRDARSAAEHLARLEGDLDLYTRLAFSSFEGPEWDAYERELVRYAFAVLRAWIATGVIRARVAERTHKRLAPPPVEMSQQDAEDLAADTIVRALDKFRLGVLGAGKWDPTKGASLKTYWIGFCVLKYPDLYDVWCTDQRKWIAGINHARIRVLDDAPLSHQDPASQLEMAATISDGLESLPDMTARILALKADGYEHVEIAELLDITVKSIES